MAGRSARVIVASSRASAGVYEDRCGPLIAEWLAQRGFSSVQTVLVADGDRWAGRYATPSPRVSTW